MWSRSFGMLRVIGWHMKNVTSDIAFMISLLCWWFSNIPLMHYTQQDAKKDNGHKECLCPNCSHGRRCHVCPDNCVCNFPDATPLWLTHIISCSSIILDVRSVCFPFYLFFFHLVNHSEHNWTHAKQQEITNCPCNISIIVSPNYPSLDL